MTYNYITSMTYRTEANDVNLSQLLAAHFDDVEAERRPLSFFVELNRSRQTFDLGLEQLLLSLRLKRAVIICSIYGKATASAVSTRLFIQLSNDLCQTASKQAMTA